MICEQTQVDLKIKVKKIVAQGVHSLFLCDLLKKTVFKVKPFVLMYHRVLSEYQINGLSIQPGMYVTKETFQKHIRFLKNNFNVLSLNVLLRRLIDRQDLTQCCCITFDDGWLDNYNNVFPILKTFKIPATIFLATGFINTNRWFWPDEMAFYLTKLYNKKDIDDNLPDTLKEFLEKVVIKNESKADWIDRCIGKAKLFNHAQRNMLIRDMKQFINKKPGERLLMNWAEVKEMYESGLISFGAHTANHELLDKIKINKAYIEVLDSIKHIENRIGEKINLFAYPNGNYNIAIQELLKEINILAAFTTKKGFLDYSTSLLEIPRIGMHDDVSNTIPMFLSRILFKCF